MPKKAVLVSIIEKVWYGLISGQGPNISVDLKNEEKFMPNPLGSGKNITVEQGKRDVLVTKRTVRFGSNVYQTSNIAGFSEGEIEMAGVSWLLLIILMVVGLIVIAADSRNNVGQVLTGLSILGALWNLLKPKQHGLLLTINSGDKVLFSSYDKTGVRETVSALSKFIESEKDATYRISINNGQVTGNLVQGNVGGSLAA